MKRLFALLALFLLALPGLFFLILFSYVPMGGIIISTRITAKAAIRRRSSPRISLN